MYLTTGLKIREEKLQICLPLTGLLKKIYARPRGDGYNISQFDVLSLAICYFRYREVRGSSVIGNLFCTEQPWRMYLVICSISRH